MKIDTYRLFWEFNRSYHEALTALAAQPGFHRRDVERCAVMCQEARAVANSTTSILEAAAAREANCRYRQRRCQEGREEKEAVPPRVGDEEHREVAGAAGCAPILGECASAVPAGRPRMRRRRGPLLGAAQPGELRIEPCDGLGGGFFGDGKGRGRGRQ